MRRRRQIDLTVPIFPERANFECRFCLCQFELYPEPLDQLSADMALPVKEHVRQYHSEKWKCASPSESWTQRILRRKIRAELLNL